MARRLSLKQKLHFGSRAQRAAAKRAMRGKRSNPHRRRTKAARRSNSAPRKRRANTSKRRKRTVRRQNVGEIIVAGLGNPATKRRKTVAKTKRRRKTNASHRRHASTGRRTRRIPSHRTRRHRRNPGMGQIGSLVSQGIGVVGGAVGSKLATQMVLGSSNTGIFGYLGNAVSTGILAWGVHAFTKKRDVANAVVLGGTVQIILRAISDFTPYGSYLSLSGLGDYQVANWATPQWLPNGLKSANPAVPTGWGGGSAVAINSSGAGMGSLTNSPSWD